MLAACAVWAVLCSAAAQEADTVPLRLPVPPPVPQTYEQLMADELGYDLESPSNITTRAEYDPLTGFYTIRTRVGDIDVVTPFMLSKEQYENWQLRRSMQEYYRKRNLAMLNGEEEKQPYDVLNMNFASSALDRIFGPGGVQFKTQGSVQISTGVITTKTDNPALSLSARRKTYLDFDQQIQANVQASVGTRLKFNMSYNTNSTFEFDNKNLKLAYEGEEDDIVKSIEAGNVSMTTGSSLIRGSAALFGIKSKLQFGKLTATALVSQQNSETKSVGTSGGAQTTQYSINADEYDANRHFFLAQYFYENYDKFASRLPYVSSGINITRIEVWVTNKSNRYDESRNLVAFVDLGENRILASDYWRPDASVPVPSNTSNNLLSVLKSDYPQARNINTVTQALEPLRAYGIIGGSDYEKVESARLLPESEYILNPTLGYISLKSALDTDEVLAVAYQYTCNGRIYQVGEFSSDITATDQSLYVKALRCTTVSTKQPAWRLMMKNVYNLGAYQVQPSNFRLQIKYLSDTTGIGIPYLPVAGLNDKTLLQVMGLDRLDSNQQSASDGFFDFIDGYTIQPATGRVFFPVAEPFGRHLAEQIGNPAVAEQYAYNELYDSTLVVARQFASKNKFMLTGQYQASSGSQIRLNAMNVPRGSVVVTAGGRTLVENADYTVDYAMGIVTITNQSIIDSGQNINVTLENQSLFSMQRKTLLGLDLQYEFNRNLTLGTTIMHYSEKALTEKVDIGNETVNNLMLGFNLRYNKDFMWLTNLLNKIPTVNATVPSRINLTAEYARLMPHSRKSGTNRGSSYVDDFEYTLTGIDLRSPYEWFLSATPYDPASDALFPEAKLSNNVDYGKNRALLNWYYIDRMFTQRNSSLMPGYLRADLDQLSNPYVREVTMREIYPGRELNYGETSNVQTLNLTFYPTERGPYNLDADNIDDTGALLNPERRWGGIMRRMDNTNFEQSNIGYLQFWLMSPFLDPENPNEEGGDLYFNFGDLSEDILKDGQKSYENGIPYDGDDRFLTSTVWGRVSSQNSLTYSFDNAASSRLVQDVGLDGLPNEMEYEAPSYRDYVSKLRSKLSGQALAQMEADAFSPLNDPAGDNYHFYRGYDYDDERLGVLARYKRYNGVEGNSLSPEDAPDPLYQSARNVPDAEDINKDNTLNENERYFQYHVSIRPQDFIVGSNYITDKQTSWVMLPNGKNTQVEWYQFKIPLADYEKAVGGISDFSTIRFARIFLTGFRNVAHLRFASLELVRGEWRKYDFNLDSRNDAPAEGELDITVVNVEENSRREPVNYLLPPGTDRVTDPGQAQIVQLNEQSMSLTVRDLPAGDSRGVYKNTSLDLRNYKRLQMWVHAEAPIDDAAALRDGQLSIFMRLGSDVKANYYEYEIPLELTPPALYDDNAANRAIVWPASNLLNFSLQSLVDLKLARNRDKRSEVEGVSYMRLYSGRDPDNERNTMSVMGNPSLSDIRVMLIGIRNNASTAKGGTVWVNELKVTDFDENDAWAIKANMNLNMSDIATVNAGVYKETAGFGGVDQALNSRRMDDFEQYDVAVQADLGRFVPEKARLRAPIYYSVSKEKTTPKYNPLDRDVLLKDALDNAGSKQERDSITDYAVKRTTVQNFSLSGLKFDIQSKTPMPWDPANFTINYSFSKQTRHDPAIAYEYTNDYRGSLQYAYSPVIKPLRPFVKMVSSRNKNLRFLREWELQWLPSSISFLSAMSRYYYEQQVRSEVDNNFSLPVSVSKNFLWDRQLAINWNLTRSLSVSFNSNTSARIEEPIGAVNKKLFPDRYREWRDTVLTSILHLGTPWAYNQTFNASYKAPFNRIPVLDFLSGKATYNATYRWDRGATIDGVKLGNTIANQGAWNVDGGINFESLYRKIPFVKDVDRRFSGSRNPGRPSKPKAYERTYKLRPDTSLTIKHNLRAERIRLIATTLSGQRYPVKYTVNDHNTVTVTTRGDEDLKFRIEEVVNGKKGLWRNIGEHALRLAMSPRRVAVRYRNSHQLSIPLFSPNVGDIFGQNNTHGPLAPGLDFAFGFVGEGYIDKALKRGWLITDDGQTSPAVWNNTQELNIEANLELFKGLKVQLTFNRTANNSRSVQFMYDGMPTTLSGSYAKTHCAILTALRGSKASDGYRSEAFAKMLAYIPRVRDRIEAGYVGLDYPDAGFIHGSVHAGHPFDPAVAGVGRTSSDVLIPAFVAAYSGMDPDKVWLNPFPSFSAVLPNWRVTYDGLVNIGGMRGIFKSFVINHAYQCAYQVGSYSSYISWVSADGGRRGFILDEQSGQPMPSSRYNISSVMITERFAPLIGVVATMHNNIQFNAEYRDQRTLTLNTSAGQVVEASTKTLAIGGGYKIVGFNTILRMKGSQKGISNDLTLNCEFSLQNTQALIRRIESNYTQPTSGTRTLGININANYVLSRALSVAAYFNHQVNTPVVTTSAYPTTNTSYGLTLNLSLQH